MNTIRKRLVDGMLLIPMMVALGLLFVHPGIAFMTFMVLLYGCYALVYQHDRRTNS